MRGVVIVGAAAVLLAGCSYRGNLRSAADYGPAPKAPPVAAPWFDPYAAAGDVPVVWRPPVLDRRGTVVAPGFAPTAGGRFSRPEGTF